MQREQDVQEERNQLILFYSLRPPKKLRAPAVKVFIKETKSRTFQKEKENRDGKGALSLTETHPLPTNFSYKTQTTAIEGQSCSLDPGLRPHQLLRTHVYSPPSARFELEILHSRCLLSAKHLSVRLKKCSMPNQHSSKGRRERIHGMPSFATTELTSDIHLLNGRIMYLAHNRRSAHYQVSASICVICLSTLAGHRLQL
ncbi:hypothetical protein STEG23_001832 [Scotinomys teguina]